MSIPQDFKSASFFVATSLRFPSTGAFISELNFFDNMKHIQKHRRGRALTRLAAKLDEFDDTNFDTFLNLKTCFVVVYPLACSYLFNTEYTKFSDTIQVRSH